MITILTKDSRIFYSKDNEDIYCYSDKKLTKNRHFRVKNLVKIKNLTNDTNFSQENFLLLKDFFTNLYDYDKEYILPDNVGKRLFRVIVKEYRNKELYYQEELVGATKLVFRNIEDKWLPTSISKLYYIEDGIVTEYTDYKDKVFLNESLSTNTGGRFFKYTFDDLDSTSFIYYENNDVNMVNPFYYVNKMVNFNVETQMWEYMAENVFPGFYDKDLDKDNLIKIMANGKEGIQYFVPIRNIRLLEVLKFNRDILIFVPINKSLYYEYTNYGTLANGKKIRFFVDGDLSVYNKGDVEHIRNLYSRYTSDNGETYLVPYSNKNNPRIYNFGNLSEMYKLNEMATDPVMTLNVETSAGKSVTTADNANVYVESEVEINREEDLKSYFILKNTAFFTLEALASMDNGTFDYNKSLLNTPLDISANSLSNIKSYINSNNLNSKKILDLNINFSLEPNFIRLGNNRNLYYKYDPFPLFNYNRDIYKEISTGNIKILTSNNTPENVSGIVTKSIKTSDGRTCYYKDNVIPQNSYLPIFVYPTEDLYNSPLLNLNAVYNTNNYKDYEIRSESLKEDSIYEHILDIPEDIYNFIKKVFTNIDFHVVPAEKIGDLVIFGDSLFYPEKYDYFLDKMLYRSSRDIYSQNKFYYKSNIVENTFIPYGEPDRNIIIRSIETTDGRTIYYNHLSPDTNFNKDIFEANSKSDGISGKKYYNIGFLKYKPISKIKNLLGEFGVSYTPELDNNFKNINIEGTHVVHDIFSVAFDKSKKDTLFYTEDQVYYKNITERYDDPKNKWFRSIYDTDTMIRWGETDIDLSAALRINANVNMIYNRPRVIVSGNTDIERVMYAYGKILASDFEQFILNPNENRANIVECANLEALNEVRFENPGIYTIFIKNRDNYYALVNCLSTFKEPEFTIKEVGKNINISINSDLDITSIKITFGHQDELYFINNGLDIPILFPNQREFAYVPTNTWYGKYTVYITLRTGITAIHKFTIGSDFMSKSELINDTESNYYAMVTEFAPNDLETFYDCANVVYPLVNASDFNHQLVSLLTNKEAVVKSPLNYFTGFLTLGSFIILEKYVDESNVFHFKFNIPVDIGSEALDIFIFGFVIYSERDNKPIAVFKLDEAVRKENTINVDFDLPLPIILGKPKDEYPAYIFSESNTLVTKTFLEETLSNYNDRYAYASRALVNDLKNRLDFKLTNLDPELVQLKNSIDDILEVRADAIENLKTIKTEVAKISTELYPEVELYANQVKNSITSSKDDFINSINKSKEDAINAINELSKQIINNIRTIVSKEKVISNLDMQGLYSFVSIPNNDEDCHKYFIKVAFSSGRKVNFYLDLYTSELDAQIDNEIKIPFLDIRFVATNTDRFSFENNCGPYGLTFYIVKNPTGNTEVYLMVYEACTITYTGSYFLIPTFRYESPSPNFESFDRLDVGINPIMVSVRKEN